MESKEAIPRDLLSHETKIIKGRDKTSWDIPSDARQYLREFWRFPKTNRELGTRRARKTARRADNNETSEEFRRRNIEQLARTKEINGTLKIGLFKTVHIGKRLRSQSNQIYKVLEYTL